MPSRRPDARPDGADDLADAHRQHAAVRVAQHADVGAGLGGRLEHPHAVGRVVLVAVEEVLAVEEYPPALAAQEGHGVAHHRQVLLQRRPQCLLDVPDVATSPRA